MQLIPALFLALLMLPASAQASKQAQPTQVVGRVVVVLIDGTDLQDWLSADAPNLRSLTDSGSVALINTRTGETASMPCGARRADAYTTFGQSSRTTAP